MSGDISLCHGVGGGQWCSWDLRTPSREAATVFSARDRLQGQNGHIAEVRGSGFSPTTVLSIKCVFLGMCK